MGINMNNIKVGKHIIAEIIAIQIYILGSVSLNDRLASFWIDIPLFLVALVIVLLAGILALKMVIPVLNYDYNSNNAVLLVLPAIFRKKKDKKEMMRYFVLCIVLLLSLLLLRYIIWGARDILRELAINMLSEGDYGRL